MSKSTVSSKGRITVPKEIREKAMIHKGTQLDFQMSEDGTILIIPIRRHISQLKGIVHSKRKWPVTLSEIRQAISDGAGQGQG
jgi:AbrB family looped-hinge helix DNA binding protein